MYELSPFDEGAEAYGCGENKVPDRLNWRDSQEWIAGWRWAKSLDYKARKPEGE